MHSKLSRRRGDDGAVAIIVAVSLTALLVMVAMVLDFGLVRIDRQVDKSSADAASLAGMHGLNRGDGLPHPFAGVCTAVRYLHENDTRFSGLTETSGTWTTGAGTAVTGNPCTDTTRLNQACTPGTTASWARFDWTGTMSGRPLNVHIQSGYVLGASTGFSEDTLPAAAADENDKGQGCDQLVVQVTSNRKPGLGSLATTSDLSTAVRSVVRVEPGPGGYAPAMLLLRSTGCPILDAGSASGGSFVHVLGAVSSNGLSQPGTIHADSDAGGGCSGGTNQNSFLGTGADGIVAYAAPTVGNVTVADPSKPGQITSYAASLGKSSGYLYDSINNVYGSSALTSGGTKTAVTGRIKMTRSMVDTRYRTGVQNAISNANGVFANASTTYTKFPTTGPDKVTNVCRPTQADIDKLTLTSASSLYIDCASSFTGDNAGLTIPAGSVYFRGSVNPAGSLSMPNATHVYVENQGSDTDAVNLGTHATFQVNNSAANLNGTTCGNSSSTSLTNATLFVKTGDIKESGGGQLQLCRTTVFMMGGSPTGCVPTVSDTSTLQNPILGGPCPGINGGLGTGQFTQTGGDIDWTAPDRYDVMTLSNGDEDPAKKPAWSDVSGPEDLALWSESGTNNSNTYNMNGGGLFHVRGVFMVPNADPFQISGGANMNLVNAQFVSSSIQLSGNGTHITMSVDPNSGVTLPELRYVGLVR